MHEDGVCGVSDGSLLYLVEYFHWSEESSFVYGVSAAAHDHYRTDCLFADQVNGLFDLLCRFANIYLLRALNDEISSFYSCNVLSSILSRRSFYTTTLCAFMSIIFVGLAFLTYDQLSNIAHNIVSSLTTTVTQPNLCAL